jgi:flagellar protein FliL
MSNEAAAAPADGAKKKKPLVMIVLIAVLAVGGGGGASAYYFMHRGPAAPPPPPEPGIASLEPFVVNLADPGGHRFVRLTVKLVVESEKAAEELKEDELARTRARSSILELLAVQTADHLVSPEGKAELKKEIAERATHALEHVKVLDVLFSEFVVQF